MRRSTGLYILVKEDTAVISGPSHLIGKVLWSVPCDEMRILDGSRVLAKIYDPKTPNESSQIATATVLAARRG